MVPKGNGFNQSDMTSCCCVRTLWRLLPSSCAGHVNRAGESLGSSGKIANMAALLKSLFFVFNISFLSKYCVKYW